MADRTGVGSSGGLALGAEVYAPTWPPTAVAVTKLLPLLSETMSVLPVIQPENLSLPSTGQFPGQQRALLHSGGFDIQVTYNDLESLWAMWFGRMGFSIGGTDQPEELTPGAYLHTFEVDPIYRSHAWTFEDGVKLGNGVAIGEQMLQNGTFVMEKDDVAWEFNGFQITAGVFSAGLRGVTAKFRALAHSLDLSSLVNPDLSGASLPDWDDVNLFDMTLRVGPQSTITPLDSSNDIEVDRFQFGLNYSVAARQRADTGLFIGEPRRLGLPQVQGLFGKPRYPDDVNLNRSILSTPLMCSAVFVGPEIAATGINHELRVYFPHLELINPSMQVNGPRLIREDLSFQASVPGDDYAGMPTTIKRCPVILQVVSGESENVFY